MPEIFLLRDRSRTRLICTQRREEALQAREFGWSVIRNLNLGDLDPDWVDQIVAQIYREWGRTEGDVVFCNYAVIGYLRQLKDWRDEHRPVTPSQLPLPPKVPVAEKEQASLLNKCFQKVRDYFR